MRVSEISSVTICNRQSDPIPSWLFQRGTPNNKGKKIMATATAKKSTDTPTTSILDNMELETELSTPIRGRGYSPDVIAIRAQLEASLTDGKARSFPNVPEDKREEVARKIRAAGAMKNHDPIKVSTRYVKATGKLIWGPASVLSALSSKS